MVNLISNFLIISYNSLKYMFIFLIEILVQLFSQFFSGVILLICQRGCFVLESVYSFSTPSSKVLGPLLVVLTTICSVGAQNVVSHTLFQIRQEEFLPNSTKCSATGNYCFTHFTYSNTRIPP